MSGVLRSQSHSFHLDAAPARVFPLFTARGEREWVRGWEPKILSGAEERGSVFETRNEAGQATTWVVVDYRPRAGRVSYARLAHGSHIGLVDVACSATADGGTEVRVAYTLTPLHADAEAFVADFLNPEKFARMTREWQAATAGALARLR